MTCDSGSGPTMEVWRDIIGYEGRYQVSDLGRVRSLPRIQPTTTRGNRRLEGGMLKPRLDNHGYQSVSLRKNGAHKSIRVHRLVATAFLPPAAAFQVQVAHLDGTRTNNAASNLKWACNAENSDHKRFHGTQQAGEQHPNAKLTADCVIRMRHLHAGGERASVIGRLFGVGPSQAKRIVNRQQWRTV